MKTTEQRKAIAESCGWDWDVNSAWNAKGARFDRNRSPLADEPDGASLLPDYLGDLNCAADFAKHLATLGWRCVANAGLDGTWECFFTRGEFVTVTPGEGDHYGAGETLAKAICEAGLRALGRWIETTEAE